MSASEPREFFGEYRAAFARYDAEALADLFAFPLHVVSDSEEVTRTSVASRRDWLGVLERLLGAYRMLGVARAEPLELDVMGLTPRLGSARVHWELRREDGRAIYDFTAIYTLVHVGGRWRVAAVVHDEVPKLQAALSPT
ncbi:MAG: hypothetical protein M3088_03700 [Actinomycetota bacterium]|nr:hypothetical protein [Actinomycetota bacterium]